MAGHSKWKQIKTRKAATDAKKSKVFAILAKKIALESKNAGGDRNAANLKTAIAKARAENMPMDNIERAIARGAGKDAQDLAEVVYEAYGPGGAALVIEGITDNRNRTNQELKHLLSSKGFSLAAPGSALWAFSKIEGEWQATTPLPVSPEDATLLADLIAAIEDHDDVKSVYTNAAESESVGE